MRFESEINVIDIFSEFILQTFLFDYTFKCIEEVDEKRDQHELFLEHTLRDEDV